MEAKQLKFVNDVIGIETDLTAFAETQDKRRAAFDAALDGLLAKKDEIREAMNVRLVDKDGKKHKGAFSKEGQEEAIDTFRATRKGQGLTKEDMKQVGEALRPIAEAARAILETRDKDGHPLYRSKKAFEAALTAELFTPLVREGVLPENFVIDKYSEVQQLLDETFAAYKESNESLRDERELDQARLRSNAEGAGSGLDTFSARMKQLSSLPTKTAEKMGFDEKARRRIGIGVEGAKLGMSMYSMGKTLASWQVDAGSGMPKIEHNFEKQLHPEKFGFTDPDPDQARSDMVEAKRATKLHSKILKLGLSESDEKLILGALNLQEDNNFVASKEGITGYGGAIKDIIIDLALPGDKIAKLTEAIDASHHESQNTGAADKAAHEIDAKIVALLDRHVGAGIGAAAKGQYEAAVDADEIGDAAAQSKPDDQTIIAEFAAGFVRVFGDGLGTDLSALGKRVGQEFVSRAQGERLQKDLKSDPKTAFAPIVAAAEAALGAVLPSVDGTQKAAIDQGLVKVGLANLARQFDQAVSDALKADVNEVAAEAFSGLYASQFKADAALKALDLGGSGEPNAAAAIDVIADAFLAAFVRAAPDSTDKSFAATGKAIAAGVRTKTDAALVKAKIKTDMLAAMRALHAGVTAAVDEAMKAHGAALKLTLASPESQRALASKSAFPDGGKEALDELEASDKEMEAYERQLVLIDEGGIAAAELQSIEKLIEQIERDRLIAQMVLSVGSVLTSLGSSTTTIVGAVTVQVTDTLVGEIVGPLKAAKLIIKFAVAMKAAHERAVLLRKFQKSLKLSKNAVSPLQSTIQGFVNNKMEQITFRSIEDALTLVQIAAAILGSVPEPITLAVGKTMGAVATAAEGVAKVTEMGYNEKMLSDGWSVTLAAIRNPRDRATGLKALRLNPTLGMHAIAWAGMEKKPHDPIARNLLGELGLNEQTLQVNATEAKVRKYLETLLAEDRTLLDPDVITPKWIPEPIELTVECWVVATHRASTLAEPKLVGSTERGVLVQAKKVLAVDLGALEQRAESGAIEPDEMQTLGDDAAELSRLLRNYAPVSADGSAHSEMANVAASFIKSARDRERKMSGIFSANLSAQMRDAARVSAKLRTEIAALDKVLLDKTEEGLEKAFSNASLLIREVQMGGLDETEPVKTLYDDALEKAKLVSKEMAAFEED